VTGEEIVLPGDFNPGAVVTGLLNVNIRLGTFTSGDIGQVTVVHVPQSAPGDPADADQSAPDPVDAADLQAATLSSLRAQPNLAVAAQRHTHPAAVLTLFER